MKATTTTGNVIYGFQEIGTNLVIPTPSNPRKTIDRGSEKFRGLRDSVMSLGILQPLVVRPHPERPGFYDLRAGHRRLAAAEELGLGLVPCVVKDLTDQQAMEVTVTENLDREDLTALEEARGIAMLLGVGLSAEQVASDFGRPVGWVRRRARLNALIPAWAEFGDLLDVSANHLELIARYDGVVQERLLGEFDVPSAVALYRKNGDVVYSVEEFVRKDGVESLRRQLAELTNDLSLAKWALDDADLVPSAGACNVCPYRTSCNPDLFGEDEGGKAGADFCLEKECWKRKLDAWMEVKFAKLKEKHEAVIRVSSKYDTRDGLLGSSGYQEVRKSDPRAIPALVVDGYHDVGETIYIVPKSNGKASTVLADENPEAALEAKRAMLEKRRWAWVIEKVKEGLLASTSAVPAFYKTDKGLVLLCAAFGVPSAVHDLDDSLPNTYSGQAPWDAVGVLNLPTTAEPGFWVWRGLRVRMVNSLGYLNVSDIGDEMIKAVVFAAEMVGLDAQELKMKAGDEIPEPKVWAKLVAASVVEVEEIDDRLPEAQGKAPKKTVRAVKGKE